MTGTSARVAVVLAVAAAATLGGDTIAAVHLPGGPPAGVWSAVAAVAGLGVGLAAAAAALWRRHARATRRSQVMAAEFAELLAASDSARETQELVAAYATRLRPGAGAAVLLVSESGDRLVAGPRGAADRPPLHGILVADVTPRACLAIRLRHGHTRGADEVPLATCGVCGTLDTAVACEPLICAGEPIGALLVAAGDGGDGGDGGGSPEVLARLRDAAGRTAPVLAGQRERAVAEERAAADALTGLPNRRAADETLRRLVAQSGRTLSPLSVVLLDLDRFSRLNDLHGQSHGDKALAAFGRLLVQTVRASDFAARLGGTEFLVALPDTDRLGGLEVAEKLRSRLELTPLVSTGTITASFGVASLPEDAVDAETLLRKADRALYLAKSHGRNRVQAA